MGPVGPQRNLPRSLGPHPSKGTIIPNVAQTSQLWARQGHGNWKKGHLSDLQCGQMTNASRGPPVCWWNPKPWPFALFWG